MAFSKQLLFSFFLIVFVQQIIAQPSLQKMQVRLQSGKKINTEQSYFKMTVNKKDPRQGSLLLSADMAIPKADFSRWLSDQLQLRPGIDALVTSGTTTDYLGLQIDKLQQYYKGIKVEHGVIAQVSKASKVALMQMEFYPIDESVGSAPIISEDVAFAKAIRFTGAQKYVWDDYKGDDDDYKKPKGELVIIEDNIKDPGKMCLAYKFNIYASQPLSRNYIYVNALTGDVVSQDAIIKHLHNDKPGSTSKQDPYTNIKSENIPEKGYLNSENKKTGLSKVNKPLVADYGIASAFTLYSGEQFIVTEKTAPAEYRLWAQSGTNSTPYITINLNHKTLPIDPAFVTDFTDSDNDWTDVDYITDTTSGALEVHWAIGQIIDYWADVQGRKSFDNNNGTIISGFHYGNKYSNAFWSGKAMFYGDGDQTGGGINAVVAVDVTGHELGHAICDKTAALVYRRESGALNEGFSDIWAACIDNYVNKTTPGLAKKPFLIADEIMENGTDALRDMAVPSRFSQPDTYKNTSGFWFDADVENCPKPIHSDSAFGNDFCGVHRNSGVLNKWFYLITNGGSGTNGFGVNYNVDSMGFDKTEKIAYFTEQILTPNSGFEAARIASLNAVMVLALYPNSQGITLADTVNIISAWNAVGVIADSVYNMANTPLFATNQFTAIGVGKNGYVWAGTANNGLYKYNGKVWQKSPTLTNHNIVDIDTDSDGGIWIAQYGKTGAQAINGGIGYYADSSFTYQQYSTSEGVPTRNVRSLFIDNSVSSTQPYKRIWAACFADLTAGISRPGQVVRGLENPVSPNYFKKITTGVYQANGFCQTIGGNKDEVWVFASSNSAANTNQILRYKTSDTSFIGFVDNSNSTLPAGFTAKAIYFDEVGKKWWVGMLSGGVYIYDTVTHGWTQLNFPTIFPPGTIVNNNAITGDTRGNIYIGTSNGYVYFGSPDAALVLNPTDSTQYKRYTTSDGLPSNNVKAITYDYRSSRLLMATDNGIMFKYILCPGCINSGPVYTSIPGNWSNPSIWSSGAVPGLNTNVIVRHAVTVTENANCNTLTVESPGTVTVNPGVQLNIEGVSVIQEEK